MIVTTLLCQPQKKLCGLQVVTVRLLHVVTAAESNCSANPDLNSKLEIPCVALRHVLCYETFPHPICRPPTLITKPFLQSVATAGVGAMSAI